MIAITAVLKKIYFSAFFISLLFFGIQAVLSPVDLIIPVGPVLFGVLGVFHRLILGYFLEKYRIDLSESKKYELNLFIFVVCFSSAFLFVLLYLVFVSLK